MPSISTRGHAAFRARLRDDTTPEFELRYADLEGGTPTAAQVNLGQRGVDGGVVAFLRGGGGKPACPGATAGTVTGTIVAADIQAVPVQGIAANEFAERWVRTVREDCLDWLLILGERHQEQILSEYERHYNHARPHPSLGLRAPLPRGQPPGPMGPVVRHDRLGGLIHDYERTAA